MAVSNIENRNFHAGDIEARNVSDGSGKIEIRGYAAVFNIRSREMTTPKGTKFFEEIVPTAFDQTDYSDCVCNFGHSTFLCRYPTLRLGTDERGLHYSYDHDDTDPDMNSVLAKVRRQDITGSSFAFIAPLEEDVRIYKDGEKIVRQILRIRKLIDVGPVPRPAYNAAFVGLNQEAPAWMRSIDALADVGEVETLLGEANAKLSEAVANLGESIANQYESDGKVSESETNQGEPATNEQRSVDESLANQGEQSANQSEPEQNQNEPNTNQNQPENDEENAFELVFENDKEIRSVDDVNIQPTEAQKQAGNYKKGRAKFHGMAISVENPAGSIRSGTNSAGESWSVTMGCHYGYIRQTVGADKDHMDIFFTDRAAEYPYVFVIDQAFDTKFDEHKVVAGAKDQDEARQLYLSCYSEGWGGLGAISYVPIDPFKCWAYSSGKKRPLKWTIPVEPEIEPAVDLEPGPIPIDTTDSRSLIDEETWAVLREWARKPNYSQILNSKNVAQS